MDSAGLQHNFGFRWPIRWISGRVASPWDGICETKRAQNSKLLSRSGPSYSKRERQGESALGIGVKESWMATPAALETGIEVWGI